MFASAEDCSGSVMSQQHAAGSRGHPNLHSSEMVLKCEGFPSTHAMSKYE